MTAPAFRSSLLNRNDKKGLLLLLSLDLLLHVFVSKEGEENVIENLDGIDVEQSLRRGYERKVHYVKEFLK
jgi:hypothetical protein